MMWAGRGQQRPSPYYVALVPPTHRETNFVSSALHPDNRANPSQVTSNRSAGPSIVDLIETRRANRRDFLKLSLGTTAAALALSLVDGAGNPASAASPPLSDGIGFASVPANTLKAGPMTDAVTVPSGYTARVLIAWGDSLNQAPHWDSKGPMDEATQARCFGAHNDGMHYFPFAEPGHAALGNERGLLCVNHEYNDPALVANTTAYAQITMTQAVVDAQLAAHGVSVVELRKVDGRFEVQRPSAFNRRITGKTPCLVRGPAAGDPMLRTPADPTGKTVLGTLNNCSMGHTPWGTYLTCEENFNGYFGTSHASLTARPLTDHERRYGLAAAGFGYRWHEVDARFDLRSGGEVSNEPNRFGWVVEIDPWDPSSTPVKRTALGRFKHESAMLVLGEDNTVAVYMGDDERNEYIYKFVSSTRFDPRNRAANRDLLDDGTLYVARFNADGTGNWLPLVWGENGLVPANGFASPADVLIKCRQAADRVGATMMDRPEWAACHPTTREIYMTLTNNSRRGNTPVSANDADGTTSAANANPPIDTANPRPDNDYGHIIRWRDQFGDVRATSFTWDIFVKCGDKAATKTLGATYNAAGHDSYIGDINGDDYGAPDGLWFDKDGRLWIQTDQPGDAKGDWANIGGNMMMCADPSTGATKRFLTSPPNCEVTGVVSTPDGRTMFIGIQHPGEDWTGGFTQNSSWPDNGRNGTTTQPGAFKPRSSVVVITKNDGGIIGT
jgi:secreted PhoX family phosphatase